VYCVRKKNKVKCKYYVKSLPNKGLTFYNPEMNYMNSVLIIDDDEKLQNLLGEYLRGYGFEVNHYFEGTGASESVTALHPDIVLLDYMMPGKDGFEVLREIREKLSVPVIMLTAKGDPEDRIVGLELGADDYIAKPFNTRELLARMRAVLRRASGGEPEAHNGSDDGEVKAGEMILSPSTMTLSYGEKRVMLSRTEFRIMEALMKSAGSVLSRDAIMNAAQGRDSMAFERSIDVHVSKLRSKVEEISGDKNRIKTIWGTGYMFVI